VQIDLGGVYNVDKVVVWHYAADGRTYHNTKTQVSADGTNWMTVYDSAVSGEYPETAAGKTHSFTTMPVRYVRDWINGSTSNVGNHWVEIQVWGQRSVTYIGNYLEWTGATNTMKTYYYAGATRVAMREGSSVYYLLGDHLGSTSLVTDPGGVILSAARYDPWGELRAVSGPSQTRYGYTGQRAEKGLGLYFYGARFYDPQLSRFLSADSIIPQQQGVQAWDRYAYVSNNPLKYTDPSGHMVSECGPSDCAGDEGTTYPNPGQEVSIGTSPGCQDSSYVECFYSRTLFEMDGTMEVDNTEFHLLEIAVFFDIRNRDRSWKDRTMYDTPFWDAGGAAPGQVCWNDGTCYERHEVNYFAQGMWSAAEGEPLWFGEKIIVGAWKKWNHFAYPETYPSSTPSAGTLHWFEVGYQTYNIFNENYQYLVDIMP